MKYLHNLFSEKIWLYKDFSRETVISLVIITLFAIYPRTANAGLFSFIFDITGDKASADVSSNTQDIPNSQNMALLKATVNPDPNSQKNLENNSIISSENALLAEIGPAGSISDIENQVNTQISIYTVRSGDTLSEIAQMFDVSVNTIMWANNLTKNSYIKEGQTLIILPISGIRHTVKKGETIKGIVSKYKADLNEVLVYNDLSLNSVISEGDTIIIPDAEPDIVPSSSSSLSSSGKTSRPHDTNGPSYPGYYMRPIVGGRKSQGLHGYNAVDLAAPVGTSIHASASGTVIASMTGGWNGGYGNYVIISHSNGTQTLYAHNSVNLVSVGQKVQKGDIIAKIGVTGKTTGPHVHFEIRGAKNPF